MRLIRNRGLPWCAALLALTVAACAERGTLYELEGEPIFTTPVDASASQGLPRGSLVIDRFRIAAYDFTVPNALGRATPDVLVAFNAAAGYIAALGHGSTTDPRSPAPLFSGNGAVNFYVIAPNFWGEAVYNFWYPFGFLADPTKRYAAGLARYAVNEVGELDHTEMALTGAITQPDELVLVNPNPAGHFLAGSNFDEWDTTGECREVPSTTANPLILAGPTGAEVQAAGHAVDVITCSGPWAGDGFDIDNHPIERNRPGTMGQDQYNYMVIYEADPVTGEPFLDRIVARRQLAPDLMPGSMAIHPQAMAPYPTAQMSVAAQLAGPGVAGAPDSLTARVFDLQPLVGATYQAWLYHRVTGEITPATGSWVAEEEIREVTDQGDLIITYELIDEGEGPTFPGFAEPGFTVRHTFRVSDAMLDGTTVGDHTHLFLSIEASEASTPASVRPIWRQYTDASGTVDNFFDDVFMPGDLRFGWFGLADASRVFTPGGSGAVDFFGGQLRAVLSQLNRPPIGYYYNAWLVNVDGDGWVNLGPIEQPDGTSLRDADIDQSLAQVSPVRIISAQVTAARDDVGGAFQLWRTFEVTLEAKASADVQKSPATVLSGPVPDQVQDLE